MTAILLGMELPVIKLHDEVDRLAAGLAAQHDARMRCRLGCSECCVDGLTVFPVEAARIEAFAAELLQTGSPHPPGRCAFLDDQGGCRIYAHRPYVCRTQGLPLRWLDEDPQRGLVELRDICPLNEEPGDPPVESIPPEACWTIGPFEGRLAHLQAEREPNTANRRISLRSLFKNTGLTPK